MKRIVIVGGAGGIGLSLAHQLAQRPDVDRIEIVDRNPVPAQFMHPKFQTHRFDLSDGNYAFFDRFLDCDGLLITAGFGRLALFKDLDEDYIIRSMDVNATAVMRLIHRFYPRLAADRDFYCGVMVSIAGYLSSPFYSVYGASKAALRIFIESVNVELEKSGSDNRILNVSPGSIPGTGFNRGETDLELTAPLARQILEHWFNKDDLFIPQYEEVYRTVLERYHNDFREEGRHSYEYKLKSGRI